MILMRLAAGLTLRTPEEEDAVRLFALIDANRAALEQWMPWLDQMQSVADALAYIRFSQDGNQNGRFLNLLLWEDERPVGVLCFFSLDQAQRRGEIGYWLDQACQGRGVMRHACAALVDYGFNQLNLYRIQIACATDNLPSRSLSEHLGFSLEGVLRGREWIGTRVLDHAIYGLLRPDWQASHTSPDRAT
jgi:ribosomal-protein-serine acetyltransferase